MADVLSDFLLNNSFALLQLTGTANALQTFRQGRTPILLATAAATRHLTFSLPQGAPNIAMSADPFINILDINTGREPRVTSFSQVVVRLQSRAIPMFLARAQRTFNYVCILPALRDNLTEHRIYNVLLVYVPNVNVSFICSLHENGTALC